MTIHKSAEDYLETILMIKRSQGNVRSIDVVHALGVSKPSVSVAMKKLREGGYIEMAPSGEISLLPKGKEIAKDIYARHQILTAFLQAVGVGEEQAEEDACKIEHDLSHESIERIEAFMKKEGWDIEIEA